MPPPPRMRVATSGTFALSQDYGASLATAGLVLTSQGPDQPPDWMPAAGGSLRVNAVVFVDSTAPLIGQAGTLDHPFRTIQQAVTYACATYPNGAIIRIAPAGYAENITIPVADLTTLVFDGWGNESQFSAAGFPTNTGDLTVHLATGGTTRTVCLGNLRWIGNVVASNTGVEALNVHLLNVGFGPGTIEANDLVVNLQSVNFEAGCFITGDANMSLVTDGFSWGQLVRSSAVFAPVNYVRQFLESGCDWNLSNLNVQGLAIGDTTPFTLSHSTAREGEFGQITKIGPAPPTDYFLTFSHTGAGTMTVMLTNVSRASGTFTDPVQTLCWHQDMPAIPEPP